MPIKKKDRNQGQPKISLATRIIEKLKRNKVVAAIIVAGTVTIGVGSFFGAVTKIAEFVDRFMDPKPTTVAELQSSVRITALQVKQSFEAVTAGRKPPLAEKEFAGVNRQLARIERLDPGNGHVIYYRAMIIRWRDQRLASHPSLMWYLERAKDPNVKMAGDNGDARFCFDNWLGYCSQRQAYINHVLALDFERAAQEEPNGDVALPRLKAALARAEAAIALYGEFNAPGQGQPTRTLAESLRKRIEVNRLVSTSNPD